MRADSLWSVDRIGFTEPDQSIPDSSAPIDEGSERIALPRSAGDFEGAQDRGEPRRHAGRDRPARIDGRALSPTHCRRRGRLYRYYVAQRVLTGERLDDAAIVRRVSAAEIETAVIEQVLETSVDAIPLNQRPVL